MLDNGLDQLNVNIFLKPYIRGLFLILALVLNTVAMRLAAKSARRGAQQFAEDHDDAPLDGHTGAALAPPPVLTG